LNGAELELAEPKGDHIVPLIDRPLPLWRKVLILAIPSWGQQFLQLAVTLSDGLLAGRFVEFAGSQSVAGQAAQTNANYLQWFIGSFAVLVSAGATAMVAHFWGARNRTQAVAVCNQALLLGLLFGLACSGLGLLLTHELMWLLQLQGDAADLAAGYLRPLFLVLPLHLLMIVGIAALIGAGDTVSGMLVMTGVAVVNIPLAWMLSHEWADFPSLGFSGISTGTAISQALGCIAVLVLLARGRAGLQLDFTQWKPQADLIRRLLRISIPAGIDSMLLSTGQLIFLSFINRLDAASIAGHGIALRWEGLGYMSGNAFAVAAMTLVGQYLGARRPEQAARAGWTTLAMGCGVMAVMGFVFLVLAEPMFLLFCPRPEQRAIIDQGVPALRLIAFAMPAAASCFIFTGALRGAGDTRVPILFSFVGFFGLRLPLAWWLAHTLDWGLIGAWWAMCADLLLRGIAFLWRFSTGEWKRIRV
jgi:putative MATE family efflux protein